MHIMYVEYIVGDAQIWSNARVIVPRMDQMPDIVKCPEWSANARHGEMPEW